MRGVRPPALAVLVACLAGCGAREGAVCPVAGTVTVGGRPAVGAMVAFHPVGSGAAIPVGCTGPDGLYRLMTHVPGDGAPAGEYAVTVVWPHDADEPDACDDALAHDRFRGRYADPAATMCPSSRTPPATPPRARGRPNDPLTPERFRI